MKKQYRQPFNAKDIQRMLTQLLLRNGCYFSLINTCGYDLFENVCRTIEYEDLVNSLCHWEKMPEKYFFWWRINALWLMELKINGILPIDDYWSKVGDYYIDGTLHMYLTLHKEDKNSDKLPKTQKEFYGYR